MHNMCVKKCKQTFTERANKGHTECFSFYLKQHPYYMNVARYAECTLKIASNMCVTAHTWRWLLNIFPYPAKRLMGKKDTLLEVIRSQVAGHHFLFCKHPVFTRWALVIQLIAMWLLYYVYTYQRYQNML